VKKRTQDKVNHPAHYNTGKIEVIEFIEDQNLGYHLGNAVKYVARAGKKDPEKTVEDLEKAVWYIRRKIACLVGSGLRPNEMPQERVSAKGGRRGR
jgi:hypothetical protein